jgi:O-antigen/teichoic acid export membrane protein
MGSADRIIRLLIAALIVVLYLTHVISGTWAIILGILAAIFVLTSFVGTCPLYLPFRINTNRPTADTKTL